jgi:hypothetical protein
MVHRYDLEAKAEPSNPFTRPLMEYWWQSGQQQRRVPRRMTLLAVSVHLDARRDLEAQGMNALPFSGCLCILDEPSTRPPGGAALHRVVVPKAVAEQKMAGLRNKPVNVSPTLDDHDRTHPVGTVTDPGWIEGNRLMVKGVLWDRNVPDLIDRIKENRGQLGMSYEISSVAVESEAAAVWRLQDFEFVGLAVLRKQAAAYAQTFIDAARRTR